MSIQYEAVIGLEIHVQVNTLSKAFNSDRNAFTDQANEFISPITLAHPGTLPSHNIVHLEKALKLACAFNCSISSEHRFDRKQYFYPDLPKGYQLTQDSKPYCKGGSINYYSEGQKKSIRLHHIHMEEDAGKLTHLENGKSAIDYNRSGVPLLEIVTEPDFRSGQEVHDFLTELQRIVRYLDVSDGNMEEGSFRCDCNVSIMPKGSSVYGERCEIKNQNSKKFAKSAIEAEIQRQQILVSSGQSVVRATLLYDTVKNETRPMRLKESANDYRYFVDPDLAPMTVDSEKIEELIRSRRLLPSELITKFLSAYNLSMADADVLVDNEENAISFIDLTNELGYSKELADLIIHKVLPYTKSKNKNISDFVTSSKVKAMVDVLQNPKISKSAALSQVVPIWLEDSNIDPFAISESLGLLQNDNQDFLDPIITEVLENFPDKVTEYKKGKKGLIGFFMGQVKSKVGGAADPKSLQEKIEAKLE
jgi:aspartyl-tRNA(Asn)/glutamyl-tRNA(Gln) amidotransferase subunit B